MIEVKVTQFKGRKYLLMYYDNPLSGKREWKSSKATTRREADRAAGKWQAELNEGRHKPASKITWADFREQFEEMQIKSMTDNAHASYASALNAVERNCKIERLAELTSTRIAFVAEKLLAEGLSIESVRSYLTHLRAALNWAHRKELLQEKPKFDMPRRDRGAKVMKGRPITAEELERMLLKVEAGIALANTSRQNKNRKRPHNEQTASRRQARLLDEAATISAGWRRFLLGLWWSGLRLSEAATLSWDDERFITVDTEGKYPRLRIAAGQDKSGKERLLPLAPEFAEMLLQVPKADRKGLVFPLTGLKGKPITDVIYVSRVIGSIGTAASVKVHDSGGKVKFASAHDLRRAFGVRWSTRVMPAVLKELMRHADISTTMKYYAGQDAGAMEEAAYEAFSRINGVNTFVNNSQSSASRSTGGSSQATAK